MTNRVYDMIQEYATGWVNTPWRWSSGQIDTYTPKEELEYSKAYKYSVADSDKKLVIGDSGTTDFAVRNITPDVEEVKSDIKSTASFGYLGYVGGEYKGTYDQHWEFPIPKLWDVYKGDMAIVTVDLAIRFGDKSWTPDQRQLDRWVWDFDVGSVLIKTLPYFMSFHYFDPQTYRLIVKQTGIFDSLGTIRFGCRLNMVWHDNQPQTITLVSQVTQMFSIFSTAVRIPNLISFSEDSTPISSNLSISPPLSFEFIPDADDESMQSALSGSA